MNIALIGLGSVGRGLLEILQEKGDLLAARYGFSPRIVGVVTGSRGNLFDPAGLAPDALLALGDGSLADYPGAESLRQGMTAAETAAAPDVDVLVEASPSDLRTGGSALSLCHTALDAGKHVVLANKGPAAVAYPVLADKARANGVALRLEATVMAGTPAVRMATHDLAGCEVHEARGILNGTTNYILTQMETGMGYEDALAEAQAKGYAETDPAGDVEGWDAAGKAIILGALLYGTTWTLDMVDVTGITGLGQVDVEAAHAAGERWKLLASVTPQGASVMPVRLPLADPLAGVGGATNAITYSTDLLGDVTLVGAGAGGKETGFALLADLLVIHRDYD